MFINEVKTRAVNKPTFCKLIEKCTVGFGLWVRLAITLLASPTDLLVHWGISSNTLVNRPLKTVRSDHTGQSIQSIWGQTLSGAAQIALGGSHPH